MLRLWVLHVHSINADFSTPLAQPSEYRQVSDAQSWGFSISGTSGMVKLVHGMVISRLTHQNGLRDTFPSIRGRGGRSTMTGAWAMQFFTCFLLLDVFVSSASSFLSGTNSVSELEGGLRLRVGLDKKKGRTQGSITQDVYAPRPFSHAYGPIQSSTRHWYRTHQHSIFEQHWARSSLAN